MTEKKSISSPIQEAPTALEHTTPPNQNSDKEDPTNRWTERVREMIEAKNSITRQSFLGQQDKNSQCPLRIDVQAIADYAQENIAKRPLTSMVIAATAGATVTALLAALISNSRRSRRYR